MEFGFGTGVLTGTRNDTSGTFTPRRFGALQGVSIEFSGDIKELYSLSQYAIDVARGKTKITGKAKLAEIKGYAYNDLFFGQTVTAGQTKYAFNESTTLGTGAASYTVANSSSVPLVDQGVFLASNGNQLEAVASAPGSNQYTFTPSTGVYLFSTFSSSLGVLANYTYTATTGFRLPISQQLMGNTPSFQMVLLEQFEGQQTVLVLNKCISSRLSFPTTVDDYIMQDLDFSAVADSAGNVGTWSTGS